MSPAAVPGLLLIVLLLGVATARGESPFSIQVVQRDASNLVFVVSNISSTPIRLPTSSYAILGMYEPATVNDWHHWKTAHIGLWLTDDWRYMGTNWLMNMSQAERTAQLAPSEIKPGACIRVVRAVSSTEAEMLSLRTVAKTFTFQVSRESAERYGLTSGYAETTNMTEMVRSGTPSGVQ